MVAPPRHKTRRRLLIALLLLLLLMAGCSMLEGSAASLLSITFQLDDEADRIVGKKPVSGGPVEKSTVAEAPAPSGSVPQGTRITIEGGEKTIPSAKAPARDELAPIPPDASSANTIAPVTPSAANASKGKSGGSGNGGGGGGGSGGGGPPEKVWVLSVLLRSPRGKVFEPRYHLENGEATISIDDRRFSPGFYTLILTRTDRKTGASERTEQVFPWGVLALNTDADRYRPGETGLVAIGVLDADGAIICDAELTLAVLAPSGALTTLSTTDGTIRRNATCGTMVAGLLTPDYETNILFAEEGTYALRLLADRGTAMHSVSTMESLVSVTPDPPVIVSRTAATRLWPVAPSTMEIHVFFRDAFTGDIEDRVPLGFVVTQLSPLGTIRDDATAEETVLRWSGSWAAGETAILSYTYDAPDISPEFYLIGPLQLTNEQQETSNEQRSWQIANDDPSRSTSYDIPGDTIVSGGGEQAVSSNYLLADTLGEPIIGPSTSNTYTLDAGYRQADDMEEATVSISCDAQAALGTIVLSGLANATFACTVTTTNANGYSLSWHVPSGSGGTATGSLIDAEEHVIPPYAPAAFGTPEPWSVASTDAAWGGRLRSASTDADSKWGTDTTAELWLNVGTGSYIIVSRESATAPGGSTEQLSLRVDIGSLAIQPNGAYQTTITLTAAAL